MANKKISELPTATTIGAGDLLPVVQGGVTKQATHDLLPLSAAQAAAVAAGYAPKTLDPMAAWTAALANRANAPARILGIGDSIMGGAGSTTRAGRWPERLLTRLRTTNPTTGATGGVGYQPSYYPGITWGAWATATSGTITDSTGTTGLAVTSSAFAAGASRTYPVTGDGFDIWSNGSGAFTYAVDGGAAVTVTPTGARQVTAVTGLTAASHSIVVTATAAFTLEGIVSYNGDRAKGIIYYDSAVSGAPVSSFSNNLAGFIPAVNLASPDLVIVELGANDADQVSAATYQANLTTLLTALTGLTKKPSILVVTDYQQNDPGYLAPWGAYALAAKTAAATAGAAYLDLSGQFPLPTTSGLGFFATNGFHLSNSGAGHFAGYVCRVLDPAHAYPVETFSGVDGSMPVSDWLTTIGTSSVQLGRLQATTTSTQASYNGVRLDRVSMPVQADTEVLATVTAPAVGVEQYLSLIVAGSHTVTNPKGFQDGYACEINFAATAASSFVSLDLIGANSADTVLAQTAARTLNGGTAYKVRFALFNQQLFGKVWDATVAEPSDWDLSYTISGAPLTGKVSLWAQGGANTTGRTFTFDDVTIW